MTTTARTQPERSDDYVLGVSEAERGRLLAQGEMYRAETEELLDLVGVAPGWRTVDVGCGPLGVLGALADRVGPIDSVVGVERDPRMLAMAQASLAERGLGSVQLVQADAAATGLPANSFDLVHERLVRSATSCPTP